LGFILGEYLLIVTARPKDGPISIEPDHIDRRLMVMHADWEHFPLLFYVFDFWLEMQVGHGCFFGFFLLISFGLIRGLRHRVLKLLLFPLKKLFF
jgi:hypothetical protein